MNNDKETIQTEREKYKLDFLGLWTDFSCHLVIIKKQKHVWDLMEKMLNTCIFGGI